MNCGAENTCVAKARSAGKKCWLVAGSYAPQDDGHNRCVHLHAGADFKAVKHHRHCKECGFYELKHTGTMMPALPADFAQATLSRTI
jgi:hypothetical protein